MTKKDYIEIAKVLKCALKRGGQYNSDLVSEFADMLKRDNIRFDRTKFFNAVFAIDEGE